LKEASPSRDPVVLLSPACASDQYRNFEVRSDAFQELVRVLSGVISKSG
jgi:UDP-N-acetylmuramoylalanine--D-glutamate ligase